MWLVTYKKADPDRYISRDQVLDELLCFGWIDGARRALDARRTMQLVGPRLVLHWAQSYKDRAERLVRDGRMHPAGLAAIEASKDAGQWHAMDDVDALRIPHDLATALAAHPPAAEHFAAFPASTRRWTLRWIAIAKSEQTRTSRIATTATFAARGERVPQS